MERVGARGETYIAELNDVSTLSADANVVSVESVDPPEVVEESGNIPLTDYGECNVCDGPHYYSGFWLRLTKVADALGKVALGAAIVWGI